MQMRLGESLRFTLFGTSHGPKVGAFLEGVPKGIKINRDLIQKAMDERKPGGKYASKRKEPDNVEILSGIKDEMTTGEIVEISNSNLHLQVSDINELREHLYQKINKPIILNNCKIFLKNGQNDVILISPVKKILYKINNKTKVKNFIINGEIFGLNFKSAWKRNYNTPNNSTHEISIVNPNIEIKNFFEFISSNEFKGISQISYLQDRMEYFLNYNNNKITISSPNKKKNNFNLNGVIQLSPFYFESEMHIKNKKVENIIDNILLNLLLYDRNYLGNINGNFKIKLSELNNKLLKKGELDFVISEKEINLKKAKFYLDKIGYLNTNISFIEKKGDIKFISKNQLIINNYIEFAKTFQIS